MNPTEDLSLVLAIVARATGIPEPLIFTQRRGQEYYDARWIAVELLHELGYYPAQIADITGVTHRNVNKILTAIADRTGCTWRIFSVKLERCRNAMGTQGKT